MSESRQAKARRIATDWWNAQAKAEGSKHTITVDSVRVLWITPRGGRNWKATLHAFNPFTMFFEISYYAKGKFSTIKYFPCMGQQVVNDGDVFDLTGMSASERQHLIDHQAIVDRIDAKLLEFEKKLEEANRHGKDTGGRTTGSRARKAPGTGGTSQGS